MSEDKIREILHYLVKETHRKHEYSDYPLDGWDIEIIKTVKAEIAKVVEEEKDAVYKSAIEHHEAEIKDFKAKVEGCLPEKIAPYKMFEDCAESVNTTCPEYNVGKNNMLSTIRKNLTEKGLLS